VKSLIKGFFLLLSFQLAPVLCAGRKDALLEADEENDDEGEITFS